jgi:hypothetical protein
VEHSDIWGTESKLFAFCYQQVREQAGPYKIFGSREVNNVGSCIHKYADAIQKTDRALYQA